MEEEFKKFTSLKNSNKNYTKGKHFNYIAQKYWKQQTMHVFEVKVFIMQNCSQFLHDYVILLLNM